MAGNNNMALTNHTVPGFCAFDLCALHNPNLLEFVFTKQQTQPPSVEHVVVWLDEYFQK